MEIINNISKPKNYDHEENKEYIYTPKSQNLHPLFLYFILKYQLNIIIINISYN
jgi:hypothetical protein